MKPVVIRRSARGDLVAAIQWYDDQQEDLGHHFETAILRALGLISQLPQANLAIGNDLHRYLVNDYSYAIYYRDKPDHVVVYAIVHGRRDPRHIERRLRNEDRRSDETET